VTLKSIFNKAIEELEVRYERREAESILRTFLKSYLNVDSVGLELKMNESIEREEESRLEAKLEPLFSGMPVQYLLNEAYFYDLKLYVDERVLIPRPETEELVDRFITDNEYMSNKALNIIDIGTGSGCIALAIKATQKQWSVTGVDVSVEALSVAKINAETHSLDVHFEAFDILSYYPSPRQNSFDFIISNPPYISKSESTEMRQNVLDFEPHMALFPENSDPLIFYKSIANFAHHYLSEIGKIYVEINEHYGIETLNMFKNMGFKKTTLIKDLSARDRFIIAER